MSKSMSDIENMIDEEIKNSLSDLIDYPKSRSDKLQEMVDGYTFNHGELASLLDSDNSLASVDDPELLPNNPSVWNIIEAAIGEKLYGYAERECERQVGEFEEMKETLEAEGFQVNRWSRQPEGLPKGHYVYKDLDEEKGGNYHGEKVYKDGFKSEVEAWTWLEANQSTL